MTKPFPEDKVGQRLRELGFEVSDYKATDSPYDNEILGKVFVKDNAEITYNYSEDDTSTLIIGLYRALKKKPGLYNHFAELLWFLDFLKREDVGVQRVTCTVKIPNTAYVKPLMSYKMIRFCTELMGGHVISGPNLIPWYMLDLRDYTGLRLPEKTHTKSAKPSVLKRK